MYDNPRQEGAYQLLISQDLSKIDSDDAMESYVLGLQRRFALTNEELSIVVVQSALTLIERTREHAIAKIEEKEASPLYKAALRAGVEAKILPTEIRARIKKERF
jgi:hypothetical protein